MVIQKKNMDFEFM